MSNITLVTSFFDIGRSNAEIMPRSTEKYFNDFKFWTRMQNDLIVFTTNNYKEKVISIRRDYGLEEHTIVKIIDDIWNIEPMIFSKMKKIETSSSFLRWRQRPKSSDNQAKYNYITMMKFWFMNEAAKMVDNSAMIAWIDFGYNHGGQVYTNPEEFNFKWDYDFGDKISLFVFKDTWKEDLFGAALLQSMVAVISASTIVAPASLCNQFYKLIKNSMEALLMLDCMDDDQMLMFMAYRQQPDIFSIRIHRGWHWVLKEYGGEHLSVKEPKIEEMNLRKKVILFLKDNNKAFRIKNYITRKWLDKMPDEIYWARLKKLICEYHEV